MSIESDMDGAIVNEPDPLYSETGTERLGTDLWVIAEAGGCVIFRNQIAITLTVAELEELVRVAVRHGILNLAGGRP